MTDEKTDRTDDAGDFRYDTGDAAVPWAAVGESLGTKEIKSIVRFLAKPRPGHEASYEESLKTVDDAVDHLWEQSEPASKLSLGDNVGKLEEKACGILKSKHSIFMTNATHGFEMAFKYANLGPGDEVIAPSISFIATIAYPLGVGARVVFADLDPSSANIDPQDVIAKITDKTKVIIPVHIGGYPVDMDPIMEVARERDILVIEDAAHGFGGSYKGQMLGTIGDFGAFSFHEVKNVNALGEGGILTTRLDWGTNLKKARFLGVDPESKLKNWLYDVVALPGKYGPFASGNYSVTEIQALCLLKQLDRLEAIIAERRANAEYLTRSFAGVEGLIPAPGDTEDIKSTWHLYLLQVDPEKAGGDIQQLKQIMSDKGVTNIPHFAPMYKFDICRALGYDANAIAETCPNTEEIFNRRFTHLPLYPLSEQQVEAMAGLVIESVEEMRKAGG